MLEAELNAFGLLARHGGARAGARHEDRRRGAGICPPGLPAPKTASPAPAVVARRASPEQRAVARVTASGARRPVSTSRRSGECKGTGAPGPRRADRRAAGRDSPCRLLRRREAVEDERRGSRDDGPGQHRHGRISPQSWRCVPWCKRLQGAAGGRAGEEVVLVQHTVDLSRRPPHQAHRLPTRACTRAAGGGTGESLGSGRLRADGHRRAVVGATDRRRPEGTLL
jgi:hypothetical protein